MAVQRPTRPHVLIVGAGPGGLVLAQCLRKQGISYEIFDRDENSSVRPQGWSLGLHSHLDELESSIPDDLSDMREATHHLTPLRLNTQLALYYNHGSTRIGVQDTPEHPCLRVHRARFRQWLCTNIPVQWGKKLTKVVDRDENGKVELGFDDGTKARGDIVVGADGVSSVVREYLLGIPNEKILKVVPTASIVGRVTVAGKAFERQLSLGHSSYLVPVGDLWFFNGLLEVTEVKGEWHGTYVWNYFWFVKDMEEKRYWEHEASPSRRLQNVLENMEHVDEKFTEIVRLTGENGIRNESLVLREAEIEKLPQDKNVTLLGDAAHAMTPFAGEGGAHSIRDGLNLAKVLSQVDLSSSTHTIEAVLGPYQTEMLERGLEGLRRSRDAPTQNKQTKPFVWGQFASEMPDEDVKLDDVKP